MVPTIFERTNRDGGRRRCKQGTAEKTPITEFPPPQWCDCASVGEALTMDGGEYVSILVK